ncbi:MAG: hypothetical protein ACI9NC_001286 [Verrucomicrobiales bacterium]|jgi:hypothetical protein
MKTSRSTSSAALLVGCILSIGSLTRSDATLLVYEPFAYPDGELTGQGGALGTTGTWTTNDTGFGNGWWVHPGEAPSGVFVAAETPNVFDGTVDNLETSGGFAGMAGPEDRGLAAGTDAGTGNLDASIALAPSVTASFVSGTTTWFSFVGAHAWDRNQGSPTLTIGTDPTTLGSRGLTMQNSGSGVSAAGGPPRANLFDVYPHYFRAGQHNQTPGGFQDGALGGHNGIVPAFASTGTSDGVLSNDDVMPWTVSNALGFGAPNIIVGKIEWDADIDAYDIITVVKFLETDVISEAAFDALVVAKPTLSSANWPNAVTAADAGNPSNKPDLDQTQFDTLNVSGLKFFVDEIRIGTALGDVLGGGIAAVPDFTITQITHSPDTDKVTLSWDTKPGASYAVYYSRNPDDLQAGESGDGDVSDSFTDNDENGLDVNPEEGKITIVFDNPDAGAVDLFFSVHIN